MASEHGATWNADDWDEASGKTQDKARLKRSFWPKLKRALIHVPFAEDLVAAYYCAFDRHTPRHVQAALLAALAYFVLPFDAIPDLMPALGFADDAAVLATAIRLVANHITERHRQAAKRALARAGG
jgi:uncharacterized membrane protein YkvA (DUF1232 family)